MHDAIAVILGGGRGTRLYPLTKYRAKPAVPIAGAYRLIDIPISNCINSEITRIFILTQYNSMQLHRHINSAYHTNGFSQLSIEALPAQQTRECSDWFQGTADAVRHYVSFFSRFHARDVLILSGDHVYCMDYRPFIAQHRATHADITISAVGVQKSQASRYGLLKIDPASGRVTDFIEKPDQQRLGCVQNDADALTNYHGQKDKYIASMGVYLFRSDVLQHILMENPLSCDFGHDIIPNLIDRYRVHAYLFDKYWQDIGTVEAYYQANMKCLDDPMSILSCYDSSMPLFTRQRSLPPAHINNCEIRQSKICNGCLIEDAVIRRSIIGMRTVIGKNVRIEESILQGAHRYQGPEERRQDRASDIPPLGIGEHSVIKRAIIDKDARIGRNVHLINQNGDETVDQEKRGYLIINGIITVLENAIIPDNMII
ncbi:glucose-1-phosphate adenylyltransferase [candidate division KSB1 bacterium]|nr:MAG: glucose-1-phosphate adenylyltransferase [candidate division KSB1 bacterium]